MTRRSMFLVAGAAALIGAVLPSIAQATSSYNVTSYAYGAARTGDGPTGASPTSISSTPRFNDTLDGSVYNQPLLYNGQIIVATENNTFYGISESSGRILWHTHIASPVTTRVFDHAPGLGSYCGDINPLGITGTPVIDPSLNDVYAVVTTYVGSAAWQHVRHELVAVSLTNHKVIFNRVIDPSGGNAANGYIIPAEQERSALSLANGRVYVTYGGLDGDCGHYHGYVLGVATNGKGPEVSYKVPTQSQGGIWVTGGASVGPNGDIYVATGNGNSTSNYDEGDSVLQLSPTLHRLSLWAPDDWAQLNADDADLGSGAPLVLPGSSYLFEAGKSDGGASVGFLLSTNSLGTGPGAPAFSGNVCLSTSSGVFGANAVDQISATTYDIFVPCADGNGLQALRVTTTPTPSFTQLWNAATDASGGLPNATPTYAEGLVWSLDYWDNAVFALNPNTGAQVLTASTANLNHFATLTVVPGGLIIPTTSGVEFLNTH